jgi:hypothetical protein
MQRYAIGSPTVGNLLPMTTLPLARCTDCQTELQPSWKFCIACGAPVPTAQPVAAPIIAAPATEPMVPAEPVTPTASTQPTQQVTPAASTQQAIPAAIRPAAERPPAAFPTGEEPRLKINVPALVSVILGTAGVALIVYLLVVVFGSRD